jgi:hypothetical protein
MRWLLVSVALLIANWALPVAVASSQPNTHDGVHKQSTVTKPSEPDKNTDKQAGPAKDKEEKEKEKKSFADLIKDMQPVQGLFTIIEMTTTFCSKSCLPIR